MQNEYYGIATTPTDDYLAHYGVKGMKWGVRKAIEKGNTRRLARYYARAARKLKKLNDRTDISKQKQIAEKYNKVAKGDRIAGRIGLGLAVSGTGAQHLLSNVGMKKIKALDDANVERIGGMSKALHKKASEYFGHHTGNIRDYFKDVKTDEDEKMFKKFLEEHRKIMDEDRLAGEAHRARLDKNYKMQDYANTVRSIGAGMALGAYGHGAYAKIKANRAKKRTTAEGHAKAVQERNAWQREMNKAFAGTQYAPKKKKRR